MIPGSERLRCPPIATAVPVSPGGPTYIRDDVPTQARGRVSFFKKNINGNKHFLCDVRSIVIGYSVFFVFRYMRCRNRILNQIPLMTGILCILKNQDSIRKELLEIKLKQDFLLGDIEFGGQPFHHSDPGPLARIDRRHPQSVNSSL